MIMKVLEWALIGLFFWEISFILSGDNFNPQLGCLLFTISQASLVLLRELSKTKKETTDEKVDDLINDFNEQNK